MYGTHLSLCVDAYLTHQACMSMQVCGWRKCVLDKLQTPICTGEVEPDPCDDFKCQHEWATCREVDGKYTSVHRLVNVDWVG